MSCDRRCFDEKDEYFEHDDCRTCPGRDDGKEILTRHEIEATPDVLRALGKEGE